MTALKLDAVQERVDLKHSFTELECERFRNLCNFTEDERRVFDLRVKGKGVIEISLLLNMSEATVERRIRAVKRKILRVF